MGIIETVQDGWPAPGVDADDPTLQKELRRLVESSAAVRHEIAAHAAEVDAAGAMADTTFAMRRCAEEEHIRLSLPRQYGGLSDNTIKFAMDTWVAMTLNVAAADESASRNFDTQQGVTRLFYSGADVPESTKEELAALLLAGKTRLIASNAETGSGAHCVGRDVKGGIRVTGTKTFNSNSGDGGHALVSFPLEGHEGRHQALIALDDPSVTQHHDWDQIGSRGSHSQAITYNDVFVPDGWHYHALPGTGMQDPSVLPMTRLLAGARPLASGIGAYEAAIAYLKEIDRPTLKEFESASTDALVRKTLGEFGARLHATYLAIRATSQRLEHLDVTDANAVNAIIIEVYSVTAMAMSVGVEVSSGIFELTGARSASTRYNFDRFWRDARVDSVHDPVNTKLVAIGDWYFNGTVPPRPGTVRL
jgi:alkylation response protein AidB-like acyl-CoA dehydrogenase